MTASHLLQLLYPRNALHEPFSSTVHQYAARVPAGRHGEGCRHHAGPHGGTRLQSRLLDAPFHPRRRRRQRRRPTLAPGRGTGRRGGSGGDFEGVVVTGHEVKAVMHLSRTAASSKPTNVGHCFKAAQSKRCGKRAQGCRKLRRDAGAKPRCCCDPAGASSSSFGGPRRQQGRSSSPAGKTQPPRATEDTRKNRCVLRTKPSAPLPRRCARKAGKSLHAVRRAQRGLQK